MSAVARRRRASLRCRAAARWLLRYPLAGSFSRARRHCFDRDVDRLQVLLENAYRFAVELRAPALENLFEVLDSSIEVRLGQTHRRNCRKVRVGAHRDGEVRPRISGPRQPDHSAGQHHQRDAGRGQLRQREREAPARALLDRCDDRRAVADPGGDPTPQLLVWRCIDEGGGARGDRPQLRCHRAAAAAARKMLFHFCQ